MGNIYVDVYSIFYPYYKLAQPCAAVLQLTMVAQVDGAQTMGAATAGTVGYR